MLLHALSPITLPHLTTNKKTHKIIKVPGSHARRQAWEGESCLITLEEGLQHCMRARKTPKFRIFVVYTAGQHGV